MLRQRTNRQINNTDTARDSHRVQRWTAGRASSANSLVSAAVWSSKIYLQTKVKNSRQEAPRKLTKSIRSQSRLLKTKTKSRPGQDKSFVSCCTCEEKECVHWWIYSTYKSFLNHCLNLKSKFSQQGKHYDGYEKTDQEPRPVSEALVVCCVSELLFLIYCQLKINLSSHVLTRVWNKGITAAHFHQHFGFRTNWKRPHCVCLCVWSWHHLWLIELKQWWATAEELPTPQPHY